ncbi:hypothetical protein LXL04_030927 [Taraxacum kok-saghyz]
MNVVDVLYGAGKGGGEGYGSGAAGGGGYGGGSAGGIGGGGVFVWVEIQDFLDPGRGGVRGDVEVNSRADNARNSSQCDSMIIGDIAAANTYLYIQLMSYMELVKVVVKGMVVERPEAEVEAEYLCGWKIQDFLDPSSGGVHSDVEVNSRADNARNSSQCDSMLIGDIAAANTYSYIQVEAEYLCGWKSKISWTQAEVGSAVTWKYPSVVLEGDESVGEFYSVALTNNRHQADTGTKMIHKGKNTKSRIVSMVISAGCSRNCYRGLVQVNSRADNARNSSQCDSMIIGDIAAANTYLYIQLMSYMELVKVVVKGMVVERPEAEVEAEYLCGWKIQDFLDPSSGGVHSDVEVNSRADNARNSSQCDSMLIGDIAAANTYSYIQGMVVDRPEVEVEAAYLCGWKIQDFLDPSRGGVRGDVEVPRALFWKGMSLWVNSRADNVRDSSQCDSMIIGDIAAANTYLYIQLMSYMELVKVVVKGMVVERPEAEVEAEFLCGWKIQDFLDPSRGGVRSDVEVNSRADNARNSSQCDSMLIGDIAAANTYSYIQNQSAESNDSIISLSKNSQEQNKNTQEQMKITQEHMKITQEQMNITQEHSRTYEEHEEHEEHSCI